MRFILPTYLQYSRLNGLLSNQSRQSKKCSFIRDANKPFKMISFWVNRKEGPKRNIYLVPPYYNRHWLCAIILLNAFCPLSDLFVFLEIFSMYSPWPNPMLYPSCFGRMEGGSGNSMHVMTCSSFIKFHSFSSQSFLLIRFFQKIVSIVFRITSWSLNLHSLKSLIIDYPGPSFVSIG